MKKMLIALTMSIAMMATTIPAYADTAQEVIAKNPTSYTAGTSSVYGAKLNQDQLNAVAQAAADFKTNYVNDTMSNDQKIRAGYDYIKNNVAYIDWRESTYANTAYGCLVEKRAACSGMTRAFVALMDAVDVKAYWIHGATNDHQWNMVEFNDGFYFIDIDANIASGAEFIYKAATHPYSYDTASYPAIGSKSGQSTTGTQAVNSGWKEENGSWYYYESNGQKAVNKWIDGKYYVGADGAMLTNTTTPDGYQVGSDGAWVQNGGQITAQTNGIRVWMEGADVGIGSHQEGLPMYNSETRLGVSNVVILNPKANMIEFQRELGGNIEPNNHTIRIVGFKEFENGQLVALTKDGEPVSYPFEYNKPYNLDFTGTHQTAESLSKYCKENNILIRVSVEDDTQNTSTITWIGQYYAYANDLSIPNGQIGQ